MMLNANVLKLDYRYFQQQYVPNIVTLDSSESVRDGELNPDFSELPAETSGASELAGIRSARLNSILLQLFRDSTPWKPGYRSAARPQANQLQVDRFFDRINDRLHTALEIDPIEDGRFHPAETFLEKLTRSSESGIDQWLMGVISGAQYPSSYRASLMRLLSRQVPFSKEWRLEAVRAGLASEHVEVRDAAIQAAESWEDLGAVEVLAAHCEPVRWLEDYMHHVIQDLTE